jgi:folate-dependent phosphoribosylglycinamide formyltransferase PurN
MRVGLLVANNLSLFSFRILEPILKDESIKIVTAIIDQRPKRTFKQKIVRNLKRGRGAYIIIMFFQKYIAKQEKTINTISFCKQNNITVIEVANPYSHEIIKEIIEYGLDLLLLVGGFGIINEKLLKSTKYGILSYHHGDMRKYRGQPPGFWELYNNENKMGITVQILAKGLDCGLPIQEKEVPIYKSDTMLMLKERFLLESVDLMYLSIKKLQSGTFLPSPISDFGKIFTIPNFKQWIMFNFRVAFRRLFNIIQKNNS